MRNTERPFNLAKYRSYEPCFISTPAPAAEVDPGRILVRLCVVELPRDGTFECTTPGIARSLD